MNQIAQADPASTATAQSRLAELMKPCPGCGRKLTLPETEAKAALERKAHLDAESPSLSRMIHEAPYWCIRCLNQEQTNRLAAAQERMARVLRDDTYRSALLPEVGQSCTFADSSEAYRGRNLALWEQAEQFPLHQSLWLHGSPGCGKTYLALCCANRAIDNNHTSALLTGMDIAAKRRWESGRQMLAFAAYDLLVLDDLGTPEWDAQGLDALWSLMNTRAMRVGARHVVTANTEPKAFQAKVAEVKGSAFARSLMERFHPAKAYHMEGASIRLEQLRMAD